MEASSWQLVEETAAGTFCTANYGWLSSLSRFCPLAWRTVARKNEASRWVPASCLRLIPKYVWFTRQSLQLLFLFAFYEYGIDNSFIEIYSHFKFYRNWSTKRKMKSIIYSPKLIKISIQCLVLPRGKELLVVLKIIMPICDCLERCNI